MSEELETEIAEQIAALAHSLSEEVLAAELVEQYRLTREAAQQRASKIRSLADLEDKTLIAKGVSPKTKSIEEYRALFYTIGVALVFLERRGYTILQREHNKTTYH